MPEFGGVKASWLEGALAVPIAALAPSVRRPGFETRGSGRGREVAPSGACRGVPGVHLARGPRSAV